MGSEGKKMLKEEKKMEIKIVKADFFRVEWKGIIFC